MKIVMAENLPWSAKVRIGSHHIARQFLNHGHEVFWMSLPWTLAHLAQGLSNERIQEWSFGRAVQVEENLRIYSPLALIPYRNHAILRQDWVVRGLLRRCLPSLSSVLHRAGFHNVDMLWMTDPRMISIRSAVKSDVWAYRCVDELSAFSDIPPGVERIEREVVEKCDVVFATAQDLLDRLRGWRPDVYSLPNAAELDHFTRPAPPPQDLLALPRPQVLYVGAIGEWFDAELVAQTALCMPECNFILIGPQRRNLDVLVGLANVQVLGPRPYNDVPAYLQHCDVTIIPFVLSRIGRAVNPIKVYEYLAAGKPVVSTPLPELARLGLPVRVASGADFAAAIRAALQEGELEVAVRKSAASAHSWEGRYQTIAQTISDVCGIELSDTTSCSFNHVPETPVVTEGVQC